MRYARSVAFWFLGLSSAWAQELLWERSPITSPGLYTYVAPSYGDLNHDGSNDLLTLWYSTSASYPTVRVLSGADGAVIYDLPQAPQVWDLESAGDFDLDGYPDFVFSRFDGISFPITVWSPHLGRAIVQIAAPNGDARLLASGVDLNGDGLSDLLAAAPYPPNAEIAAYDHSGTVLYRIPVGALGITILGIVGLPDLDGDGCSDFLIGGFDGLLGYTRGFVVVVSGRTGTVMRITLDQQRGDLIGFPIAAVSDMDGDGITDYATGDYWGRGRAVLNVYSGATGTMIRQWVSPYGISDGIIGTRDCDLDGVPDILAAGIFYPNSRGPGFAGRVQFFSSRDQQVLGHTEPSGSSVDGDYAASIADLGVQTGSPFPVFALTWTSGLGGGASLQVWRCNPPGVQVTGGGCSSLGLSPTIGIRRVETAQGEQSRVVLGGAQPGSLAWCLAAPASASTFGSQLLPLALDPFGFSGCSLRVPPVCMATRSVGSSGFDRNYAGVDLVSPLVASLGFAVAAQWIVLDPITLGYATTPRCTFLVR